MQQHEELGFGQVLSIEIAKIGDYKNMFGTKALTLVLVHFVSLMSFSLKFEKNQGYAYFTDVKVEVIVVFKCLHTASGFIVHTDLHLGFDTVLGFVWLSTVDVVLAISESEQDNDVEEQIQEIAHGVVDGN
ncbi:unnamed protein product (macronuclear) [Paramecium tetraurelia]|uniref:Uncharacterized protein n=1 Tax=Paramecium tetraurelia TaxID=5888 RepID=A0DXP8_PARTE|nr:uncharacterized protein GSPATT00021439001 [Paramecium tetraurelia]CAK87815.1 unnamed protein product [Paramecium tetraurelia]|eukprot:XP_001455212.1 hypothetical protein (macronuclear) [Paramecium tetraurelia strain d4-2]